VVLVADQEAARQVLVEQSDVFIKKGTAFFPGSSLTGNGLLVSDGDVWKRQRRLANPAFRRAAVDNYAAAMVSATGDMLNAQWRAGALTSTVCACDSCFGLGLQLAPFIIHVQGAPLIPACAHMLSVV